MSLIVKSPYTARRGVIVNTARLNHLMPTMVGKFFVMDGGAIRNDGVDDQGKKKKWVADAGMKKC